MNRKYLIICLGVTFTITFVIEYNNDRELVGDLGAATGYTILVLIANKMIDWFFKRDKKIKSAI